VAEEAGRSEAAVYVYFPNREALFDAVLEIWSPEEEP